MIKKLLFALLFIISSVSSAQQLPLLSDIETKNTKSDQIPFNQSIQSLESYFSTKDINKKGSGYKPFKRWEYHWSRYLQADGTIAPAAHIWEAWKQKQQMKKSSKATSNWTPVGPFSQSSNSGQGRINTVFVDPNNANIIYVGAPAGGLWKSTDGGVNWTPLTDDLPQIGVSGIAIHPSDSQTIYISTGDDDGGDSYSIGVLKSTDGGNTWTATGTISPGVNSTSSNEILIDPTDSKKIWVATDVGLYLSENSGDSWSLKQSGHIRDFKLKPGDPNTIYAVSGNTFYKSTNGGDSFTVGGVGLPISSSIGRLRVEVTNAAVGNVYVLAAKPASQSWAFEGVYVSNNSGTNFSKTVETDDIFGSSQAWFDLAFAVSPTNSSEIYVGVLDIWKSTNTGGNFTKINDWRVVNASFTHADIHFLRFYNGVLYAGTDGGVYKSTDNGNTFTDLTKNLAISQFYKISVSKKNSAKIAGGLQDNGGFSLSNNTWNNYHGGDGMDAASDPLDENTFYGFLQYGGALARTTNGGLSGGFFVGAPDAETNGANDSGGNWVTPLVINKGGELYAGYSKLYRLENDAWNPLSGSLGSDLEAVEIDPSNNDIIFTSTGRTLFKSTDRGETFTTLPPASTGLSGTNISSIEVHNTDSNIVWITTTGVSNLFGPSSGHSGGGVYKSTDGGLTFTNISSGLPNESKFVVRHHPFTTNNSIYVGTALGVYHRNDDTNAWEVFDTNLPNVAISDIEINPYDNTITAATYGRSVWQSSIPSVTFPANDVDFIKIASPNKSITCGSISPSITVSNNGLNAITSLVIRYNVDGGADQNFNWTGNIASNLTQTISIPSITGLTEGSHELNVEIAQTNDANVYNNKSSTDFIVNQSGDGQITYTFGDVNPAADENPGEWVVSSDNLWEIGTPTTPKLNNKVVSGYVTNPSGNTPDQTVSLLTSPCYNLSILENPILKFDMAFALEQDFDIVYVEYSVDQGSSWNILGTASDPNWYNSNLTNATSGAANTCQNCPGAQWTGTDTTLKEYRYDLSSLNGESSIIFRFKFVADPNTNDEGVVIDNFKIDASAILSVNDFEEGAFLIYPNPSDAIFTIQRAQNIGERMSIEVYDVTGKLVHSKSDIIKNDYELNMSHVSKGLYFLQVRIDTKRLVKKLVVN